jgi:putative heme transporter
VSRRQLIQLAVGAAISIALLFAAVHLVGEAHSAHDVANRIAHLSVRWAVLAIALEALSYAAPAVILARLTRPAGVSGGDATRILLAAVGVGGLVPGQPLPAAAIAVAELRLRGMAFAAATTAAAITLVVVPATSMTLLAAPTLLASGIAGHLPPGWREGVLAAGSAALLLVGALVLLPTRRRDRIQNLLASAGGLRGASALVGLGMVAWLADAACLWAVGHALGLPMPLAALPVAYVVGAAIVALPILPGGLGGVEAAMPLAFSAAGAPLADAALVVLAWRVVSFWLPTLAGLMAWASLHLARRPGPGPAASGRG